MQDTLENILLDKIKKEGLYNLNKTDLYDYLVFLLDSKSPILNRSNIELARLFKITPNKVATMRRNISVKFYDDEQYENLFYRFISSLNENKFQFIDDFIEFSVEDLAIIDVIEARLLSSCGHAVEYSRNPKKIKINKNDFCDLLKKEAEENPKIKNILTKLKKQELIEGGKELLSELAKNILGGIFSKTVVDAGEKMLKNY